MPELLDTIAAPAPSMSILLTNLRSLTSDRSLRNSLAAAGCSSELRLRRSRSSGGHRRRHPFGNGGTGATSPDRGHPPAAWAQCGSRVTASLGMSPYRFARRVMPPMMVTKRTDRRVAGAATFSTQRRRALFRPPERWPHGVPKEVSLPTLVPGHHTYIGSVFVPVRNPKGPALRA